MDLTSITPSTQALKALTHPVRVRALGLLRIEGPATATTLAARLGLNSGATSYHLRQLAQHGFIEDDAERGTGRERWWRAVHASTTASRPTDDAEGDAAFDAYLQSVATVYVEQLQRAVEERPLLPQAWRQASTMSDWSVRLTPAHARALVERLAAELRAVEEDHHADDAELFVVQLLGFPLPGHLGPAEDPA